MKKQSGFAVVEAVVIVVVVAVLAGAGYVVWHNHKQKDKPASTAQSHMPNFSHHNSFSTTTPTAPEIKTSSDLNTAMKALNETNVDANTVDSGQLNYQTSGF